MPIYRGKYLFLFAFLLLSTWLLWPPAEEGGRSDVSSARGQEAEYVIKFSPGWAYLPDTHPYGIGKPLQGLKKVIRAFEERFPDTKIEVLNVPSVREYLVTQLSSGQAPDILNVNVENVWMDVQKGWYIPLDPFLEQPNPFVVERGDPAAPGVEQWWDMFRYQAISRGKAAPDGYNYCLTFDMIETGIYYNKTLFAELGIEVPRDWGEFVAVMQKIQQHRRADDSETVPLLVNIGAFNDWTADLFFDQLYYDLLPGIDLAKDPTREPYLQGYLDWDELAFLYSKGFFSRRDPRYSEIWSKMRELKRYTNKNLMNDDLVREFVTQRGAMIWTVSTLSYRLQADKDLGFEWGLFYLPRFTRETSRYASGQDMCVIGGAATQLEVSNSAIGDTDPNLPMRERMVRSERLKRVIAFLQFICLPEQNAQIVNEYPGLLPNIVGVETLPILKPFEEILNRRYTTTKWIFTFDLRFSEIQRRMLELYLTDGIDLDGFLQWQEKNLDAAVANLLQRKEPDMERLEKEWQTLAPLRAGFADLPVEDAQL
jgi:raffinose/stachyose/melibiose transport system substrate-binding protein